LSNDVNNSKINKGSICIKSSCEMLARNQYGNSYLIPTYSALELWYLSVHLVFSDYNLSGTAG
jgi:hypothetical protein